MIAKSKKAVIFLVMLALLAFTACAGAGDTAPAATNGTAAGDAAAGGAANDEQVTIRLLNVAIGVIENVVPYFMERHPHIYVEAEFVPTDQYFARISALNMAGQLPDVVWTQSAFFSSQVEGGMLYDLTEPFTTTYNYEGDEIWADTFNPALLENSRSLLRGLGGDYSERYFAIPYTMVSVAVIYNVNMFEEYGLVPPTNWAEFEVLNDTLVELGHVPLSLVQPWNDWFPRFFWDQYLRDELTANPTAFEDGSLTFNDSRVQAGLLHFRDMWDRGWLPEAGLTASADEMQQLFVQGNIAQIMLTPGRIGFVYEHAPDDMTLASYPFPGILGLPARSLGGSSDNFAIPVGTEHKEEALQFIRFLTSRHNFVQEYSRFLVSGLQGVEGDPAVAQLRYGYDRAVEGGFIPEMFVPVNQTPEIVSAFRSDLAPNFLMGIYDIDHVTNELQRLYEETFLATLD